MSEAEKWFETARNNFSNKSFMSIINKHIKEETGTEVPNPEAGVFKQAFGSIFGFSKDHLLSGVHAAEKDYIHNKLYDLTHQAILEGSPETVARINELYKSSLLPSNSYGSSVQFSRGIHDLVEKAKYMPISKALNDNAVLSWSSSKQADSEKYNARTREGLGDEASFKEHVKKHAKDFLKGGAANVLDISNLFLRAAATPLHLVGNFFETSKKAANSISTLDIYEEIFGERSDSKSFTAGQVATALLPIGESVQAGKAVSNIALKGLNKAFPGIFQAAIKETSYQLGKQALTKAGMAGGKLGLFGVANEISKGVTQNIGKQYGLKEGAQNSFDAVGQIVTLYALNSYMHRSGSGKAAENTKETASRALQNDTVSISEPQAEMMKERSLWGETNKVSREDRLQIPEVNNEVVTMPQQNAILHNGMEYSEVAAVLNPENNQLVSIRDYVQPNPVLNKTGILETSELPPENLLNKAAKAGIQEAINKSVKKQSLDNFIIEEVADADILAIRESIQSQEDSPLIKTMIANNPQDVDLIHLLPQKDKAQASVVKEALRRMSIKFDRQEADVRNNMIESTLDLMGMDKSVSSRFFGNIDGGSEFGTRRLSGQEKGNMAVALRKVTKAIFEQKKSGAYEKYHPELAKWDFKNFELIEKFRDKQLKVLDAMLDDPHMKNTWEGIAGNTYSWDNDKAIGSFPQLLRNLVVGLDSAGNPMSFYRSQKALRTILSKKNTLGYQKPVHAGATTDPNKSGLVRIRKDLIDKSFNMMRRVISETLTVDEAAEYNQGEQLYAGITDTEYGVIQRFLDFNIKKQSSNPETLYKELLNSPQILKYLAQVGQGTDVVDFVRSDMPDVAEIIALKNSGLFDDDTNIFSALQTSLFLDNEGGRFLASGKNTLTSMATRNANVNASKNMRGSKVNELLNEQQQKVFDNFIKEDSDYAMAKRDGEIGAYESWAEAEQSLVGKNSNNINKGLKAIKIFLGKAKRLIPALKVIYNMLVDDASDEVKQATIREMTKLFNINLPVLTALFEKYENR